MPKRCRVANATRRRTAASAPLTLSPIAGMAPPVLGSFRSMGTTGPNWLAALGDDAGAAVHHRLVCRTSSPGGSHDRRPPGRSGKLDAGPWRSGVVWWLGAPTHLQSSRGRLRSGHADRLSSNAVRWVLRVCKSAARESCSRRSTRWHGVAGLGNHRGSGSLRRAPYGPTSAKAQARFRNCSNHFDEAPAPSALFHSDRATRLTTRSGR